jgi:beta-lactamase class A
VSARLLLGLAILPVLLTACLSDVDDDAPRLPDLPASTATPAVEPEPSPTVLPPARTRGPAPAATGTPAPAATPGSIPPPEGTTGLDPDPGATRHDEACLGGETPAMPPAAPLRLPQPGNVAELPERYEPAPFVPDEALQETLEGIVGAQAVSYAFFVKDLATGRGARLNGERVFNAASLFKLFVMYALFHQESLDAIGWGDELVVTPYYDGFALSPRVTSLCQVLTVAEAMDAMLSVSDNAAAVLLQDLAGSGNVNATIEALGLQHSGLFEDGLPVTADDLALLMEAIATGRAVSAAASADMIGLLDHDVFDNGLIAGVPEGTRVARKTGNWADATHVAGIVFAPFGPYVFVALTSNGYERAVIEALSRAAYEHFAGLPARP